MFVLDASVVLSWAFPEEADAASLAMLQRMLRHDVALVPGVFPLEVANALEAGRRRGRIQDADCDLFLSRLAGLAIQVEHTEPARIYYPVVSLARKHSLSVYDAAYLELALRDQLPLATRDTALRAAAGAEGIPLFAA